MLIVSLCGGSCVWCVVLDFCCGGTPGARGLKPRTHDEAPWRLALLAAARELSNVCRGQKKHRAPVGSPAQAVLQPVGSVWALPPGHCDYFV